MPRTDPFDAEPSLPHGHAPVTGVLYCNLGTPDEPTAASVRQYLTEFLSDARVVEIPAVVWQPLLRGVILPLRSSKSAAKYAKIWTREGSPLKVWTEKQASLLQGWLGERGHRVPVRAAMRYGNPSIASQLDALKAQGATRILVLPAYPQYSGTTTASIVDAVGLWAQRKRHLPELRFVNRYHDNAGYIKALASRIGRHWLEHGRGDHLVMSFHGVPERTLQLGDPYHCDSRKTARLLAGQLGLLPENYTVTYQSRFGKAKWLEPATQPSVEALARRGIERVDVVCPGFTADCLETLEEIGMEVRHAFLAAGGRTFHYIPCLNDDPAWIAALGAVAEQNHAGWPTQEVPTPEAQAATRERALAMGAKQ